MSESRRRIAFLDELRGLCVVLMVVIHALYTIGYMYGVKPCRVFFAQLQPVVIPVIAATFFLLCGISCRLSHNNLLRGLKLLGVAVGMSLVLWIVDLLFDLGCSIWFGVLPMLALSILLCAALRHVIDRVPGWVGLLVCGVLFLLFAHFPAANTAANGFCGGYFGIPGLFEWHWPEAWREVWWLTPFGMTRLNSADYYPMLPWCFVVIGGAFLGKYVDKAPAWMYRRLVPPLDFVGRYSLPVYLIHQPVIYAICFVVFAVIR